MYYSEVEDHLEHFGVKGMKWGIRKAASGSEIRSARQRLDQKRLKLYVAEDQLYRGNAKQQAAAKKQYDKLVKDWDDDPDRAISTRLTRGETAALVLLTGPAALIPIAMTQVTSRAIEANQKSRKSGGS